MSIVQDNSVARAVSQMKLRSDRQENAEKLIQTLVDPGVLSQLDNSNNQILYGRRGTGKTHVLRVLHERKLKEAETVSVYIDCRQLGSINQATDTQRATTARVIGLVRDLFGRVLDDLASFIVAEGKSEEAWEALVELSRVSLASTQSVMEVEQSKEASVDAAHSGSVSLGADPKPALTLGTSTQESVSVQTRVRSVPTETILYPDITASLTTVLQRAQVRQLFIEIDEWTAIHPDIQPYVADFLKRTFFTNPRVTVKIASLEYRSSFALHLERNNVIGFELGSDNFSSVDLDDYYVYDRNPAQLQRLFRELLYRHMESELPADYLRETFGIQDSESFAAQMFATDESLVELVRASEGIARDLINVFVTAFFSSQRRTRDSIDMRAVVEGARDWYEKDKSINLNEEQRIVLKRIITNVIGGRKARSFLLEKDYEKHSMIQSLFDFRIIHLTRRGYSDKEHSGVRYNIYTLDYGTYVDLKNTGGQVEMVMPDIDKVSDALDRIVPYDDKRSIRRIVLRPEMLDV